MVESSNNCQNLRWYSEAGERLAQESAIDRVVRPLEIDETQERWHTSFLPQFLHPACHKHYVCGHTVWAETALFFWQLPFHLAVITEPYRAIQR